MRSSQSVLRRLLFPALLGWLLLCLPYLAFLVWAAHRDLERRDWIGLAARTRRLKTLGFTTRTTRYWLALAYARLHQWQLALDEFEHLSRPLADPAQEAARYCHHAWALHETGREGEARTLLHHAASEAWPPHRKAWAGHFLTGSAGVGAPDGPSRPEAPAVLH